MTPVQAAGSPSALPSSGLSWKTLLKRIFALDIPIYPAAEADGASSASAGARGCATSWRGWASVIPPRPQPPHDHRPARPSFLKAPPRPVRPRSAPSPAPSSAHPVAHSRSLTGFSQTAGTVLDQPHLSEPAEPHSPAARNGYGWRPPRGTWRLNRLSPLRSQRISRRGLPTLRMSAPNLATGRSPATLSR